MHGFADGNKVVLINQNRNRFWYEMGSDSIYLDTRRVVLRTRGQKDVIWLLLSSVGSNVRHDEIARICGTGSQTDEPNARSAKFVAGLCKHIEKISELDDLIVSVRGIGYTIGSNWNPLPSEIRVQKSNDFLAMLDSVVADCILHTEQRSVIVSMNGLQYLDFDVEFALQKYQLLNGMLWDTIRILSSSARPSDLIDIKNAFHHLASYVLYWRLGDSLPGEKWKADYRDEVLTSARKIRTLVDLLLNDVHQQAASSAATSLS